MQEVGDTYEVPKPFQGGESGLRKRSIGPSSVLDPPNETTKNYRAVYTAVSPCGSQEEKTGGLVWVGVRGITGPGFIT